MAILWMENFDQYGADETAAEAGAWSSIMWNLSSTTARSGTYSLNKTDSLTAQDSRRRLDKTVTTIGVGLGVYFTGLPTYSEDTNIISFHDRDGRTNIGLFIDSTGVLGVIRGQLLSLYEEVVPGTILGKSSAPVIRAHSWQRIEIKVTFHASAGAVEVRVNNVTVINLTGINTVAVTAEKYDTDEGDSDAECAEVYFWMGSDGEQNAKGFLTEYNKYIDDIVVWDTSGSYNNDFLGDVLVKTLSPAADTAQADWTALSGSAYANVDDMPGKDDDTSYVYAGVPGSPTELTSEYDLDNLSVTSGSIFAVSAVSCARKTEAGNADIQNGIVSGASESKGAVNAVGTSYAYYEDVFETDPSSGVAFTPTEVNNLKIQINRVT